MEDGNGRVTMAVLATKIDTVLTTLQEVRVCMDTIRADQSRDHDTVIRQGERVSDLTRRMDAAEGDIEKVDVTRKWESRIVEIVIGILSTIGIVKASLP